MPKRRNTRKQRIQTVPYVRGFKPPTDAQKLKAIDQKATSADDLERHLRPTPEHFRPMPAPTSENDWLAQYRERNQTLKLFKEACPWLTSCASRLSRMRYVPTGRNIREKYPDGYLYLMPLGTAQLDHVPLHTMARFVELFWGIPVRVLPRSRLVVAEDGVHWRRGQNQWTRIEHRREMHEGVQRVQINLPELIPHLRTELPNDGLVLMAITDLDLFQDDTDLFVAGLAAGGAGWGAAVFSLYRYHPDLRFDEGWWQRQWYQTGRKRAPLPDHVPRDSARGREMLRRGCRLVVHEFGHLLGFGHCIHYNCLMNGSGHLQEDFRQPLYLCPVDLAKLLALTGSDVTERYRGLAEFYREHGLDEEDAWVRARLAYLQQDDVTAADDDVTEEQAEASRPKRRKLCRNAPCARSDIRVVAPVKYRPEEVDVIDLTRGE